jgi:hypothetical protein
MVRDMRNWETLISSSFMQRPHDILTPDAISDELNEAMDRNLTSALAYASLTAENGITEADLYELIVEIPHYQQK